jgi:hypothetical protein
MEVDGNGGILWSIPKKVTIRDRDGEIERLLENAHSEKGGLNAMDKQ